MFTNTTTERVPKRNDTRADFLHGHDLSTLPDDICDNPFTIFSNVEAEALARRV